MNQPWIVAITGFLYFIEAARLLYNGQQGLSLTFFAYGLANVGLIMAIVKGSN
jgi:hypothetical protein